MSDLLFPELDDGWGLTWKCPKCGRIDDSECFDIMGAGPGNVFCTRCHCEFDPDTGAVQLNVAADAAGE